MNVKRIARLLDNSNDLVINEVVLEKARKKGQIIHGARAFNKQAPTHLKKKTTDYDILTSKPKKSAEELAKTLRRRLGKEVKVSKGSHKGTYRVKVNGEVVADYTQIKTIPKTKKVWGTKVKSLKSIKRSTQRIVKKPSAEHRREKDIGTLDRIKRIEDIEKKFSF